MSEAISRVLIARYGTQVCAEWQIKELRPFYPKKPPAVDFAVAETPHGKGKDDQIPTMAIETKWVGLTRVRPHHIVADWLRLAVLLRHHDIDTYFVLAGLPGKFRKLMETHAMLKDCVPKNGSGKVSLVNYTSHPESDRFYRQHQDRLSEVVHFDVTEEVGLSRMPVVRVWRLRRSS